MWSELVFVCLKKAEFRSWIVLLVDPFNHYIYIDMSYEMYEECEGYEPNEVCEDFKDHECYEVHEAQEGHEDHEGHEIYEHHEARESYDVRAVHEVRVSPIAKHFGYQFKSPRLPASQVKQCIGLSASALLAIMILRCYLEKLATAVVYCFLAIRNDQISCCFRSAISIAAYFGRIRMFLFELQLLSFMRLSTRTPAIAAELCWCTTFRRVGLKFIHVDLSPRSPCLNWLVIIYVCKISVSEVINVAQVKLLNAQRPQRPLTIMR